MKKKRYAELIQKRSIRNKDKKPYDNKLIIDADYCDNPDNEGEIFFQVINMSPFDIYLKKGDIIGQGIIKRYEVTDDDQAIGERQGGFGSTTMS